MATKLDISKKDTCYVWLLILCSGNPFFSQFQWLNVLLAIVFGIYWSKRIKKCPAVKLLLLYLIGIITIFITQTFIFFWNSFPAIINFCSKVFWGGSVFLILGSKFRYVYLKVITILSFFSIIFWGLSLVHIILPGIEWSKGSTILLYTYLIDPTTGTITIRNCGFPWEPGAFGCYLLLAFVMYINSLPELWKEERQSCIIILLAVLSTMSTTAYIVIAVVGLILVFIKIKKAFVKYTWITILLVSCFYIGKNVEFLSSKIMEQNESAAASNGSFNSTRVGSLLFDLYYIQKHPLVGNGLNSRTRYADHLYLVKLWESGNMAQSGNGFSGIIANMGVLFLLLYGYIFNKRNKNDLDSKDRILIITAVILLLFGEPLLSYPFLLAFPLYKYPPNNDK